MRRQSLNFCCINILLILLVGCASTPRSVVTDEHPIRAGDRLLIVIANRECPEIREVVDASGDISMPLVGKLHVGDMTLRQASKAIEAAYLPSCVQDQIKVSLCKL